MWRNGRLVVLCALLVAPATLSGCTSPSVSDRATGDVERDTTGWPFLPWALVDEARAGGEPVAIETPTGALVIAAHPSGTLMTPGAVGAPESGLPVWRSKDGGATWTVSSVLGAPVAVSDPDLAVGSDGRVWLVGLTPALTAAIFVSEDDGATFRMANPSVGTVADRPWVAALDGGAVLIVASGRSYVSHDAGATWRESSGPDVRGALAYDGNTRIVYAGGGNRFAASQDEGTTWTTFEAPQSAPSDQNNKFTRPAPDGTGGIWTAWVEETDVVVAHATANGADFVWQRATINSSTSGLDAPMWPWVVALPGGRATTFWLGTDSESESSQWHVAAAFLQANSTAGPEIDSVGRATDRPFHQGPICWGTGCQITSDRRIGDFFTALAESNGTIHVFFGTTEPGAATARLGHAMGPSPSPED